MHREPECGITYCISSNNSRSNYFFFRIKRGRLFEILLTGSLALNILFYYHIKKTERNGLFKCSKFGSLINFQSLEHHWSVLLADSSSTWQGGNKRKGGVRGAIMQGRQLIEGWLLLEEIRYIIMHWNFTVFLSLFGRDSIRSKMVWVSSIVFMNLVWRGTVASQLLPLLLTINSPWGDNVGFQFNGQWSFPRKVLYNILIIIRNLTHCCNLYAWHARQETVEAGKVNHLRSDWNPFQNDSYRRLRNTGI